MPEHIFVFEKKFVNAILSYKTVYINFYIKYSNKTGTTVFFILYSSPIS